MSEHIINVEVAEGKYRVIMDSDHKLHATRYGEPWRDLVGDNLVYNLAYELQEARKQIEDLKDTVDEMSEYF